MKLTKAGCKMKCSPSPDLAYIHNESLESPKEKIDYRKHLPGPMHTPPRLRIITQSRANRKVLLCDEYPQENQIEGMGDPYTGNTIGRMLTVVCFFFTLLTLIALCLGTYMIGLKMVKCESKWNEQFSEYEKLLTKNSQLKSLENGLMDMKNQRIYDHEEIKSLIQEMIQEFANIQLKLDDRGGSYILEKLYGDQADYALEKNGGNVYSILGTQAYAPNPVAISIYGITLWNHISNNPLTVIKGMITPGECWAFRGSGGSIVLQLAKSAIITSVAVEHIPKSLTITGNTDSAPKEFSVCAYVTEDYFPDKCLHLGDFEFNRDGPPRQQFYTELKKKPDGTAMSFRFIQFDFMTNYGNEQYTCIYRLRVYANQGT